MKSYDHRRPDGTAEHRTDAEMEGHRRFNAAYALPVGLPSRTLICNACRTHWDTVAPRRRTCLLCGRRADME
jgi:hypothetical protein